MPLQDEHQLFLTEETRAERNQALFRFTFGLALLSLELVGEALGLRKKYGIPGELVLTVGTGFFILSMAGLLLLWLSHPRRYRSWFKYLASGIDLVTIGGVGLTVSDMSYHMFGLSIPGFKSPAWYVLVLVALGPAFRFSPTFALAGAGGAQIVMVIWLVQALRSPHTVWTADPMADFFGNQVHWLIVVVRFLVTGLICRAGWLIARNSRRVVTTAVETQVGLAQEQFRRQQIRQNMQRYFPPHVAAALADGSDISGLGGERRRLVILMSDIRNFSTAAENMDPGQAVAELNRYFTGMVEVLFRNQGTLLGFIGDGMLAVYGLPEPTPDDAHRALRTAQEMLEHLRELKASGAFPGLGDFRIGIGLHVGDVMIGNIGSPQRMEFTAIGDAVNTASRAEAMNKPLGTEILVTADLVAALGEHRHPLRPMGEHQVKGKAHTLTLYTVEAS